jgi:hypothetical protein
MLSKVDPRLKSRVGNWGKGKVRTGDNVAPSRIVELLSVDSSVWVEAGLLTLDPRPRLADDGDAFRSSRGVDSGGCLCCIGSVTRLTKSPGSGVAVFLTGSEDISS